MNHPFDSNNPWTNNARGLGFNRYSDPYSQTVPYNSAMNTNYQRPSIPGRLVLFILMEVYYDFTLKFSYPDHTAWRSYDF